MHVHTLLCKADLSIALRCLRSFERNSVEQLEFIIHDDGSLGPSDISTLVAVFPSSRIIRRNDANIEIEAILARHPTCLQFRRDNVFGLKLFDTVLMCDQPVLNYCDTDIYFFRPFDQLFSLPAGCDAMFMRDFMNAYSLRSWQMMRYGVRFAEQLNAGLMAFLVAGFDLDRVEWFLSLPRNPIFAHFVEQSAWALLASRLRPFHWDPAAICLVQSNEPMSPSTVAAHYVRTYRKSLESVPDALQNTDGQHPARVISHRTRMIGPFWMGLQEVTRGLHRRFA